MRTKKIQLLVIALLLVVWACRRETRRLTSYPVQGIDISHHQQHIDWSQIAAQNIRFAFLKATEGSDHIDSLFERNWAAVKQAGIVRGAYHYFSPYSDPERQAGNFIARVKLDSADLPPVLDVEIKGRLDMAQLRRNVLKWMEVIEKYYRRTPILYTNQKYYLLYFAGRDFDRFPLWIARYNSGQTPPRMLFDRRWTFWQYGSCGRLNGIDGCVDFNVFNGSLTDFQNFLSTAGRRDTL